MKETTSELNLTLIAVIAVGVLVAFFYFAVWPSLNTNFEQNSKCSRAWCENPCKKGDNSCDEVTGQLATCWIGKKEDGKKVMCPWKG